METELLRLPTGLPPVGVVVSLIVYMVVPGAAGEWLSTLLARFFLHALQFFRILVRCHGKGPLLMVYWNHGPYL